MANELTKKEEIEDLLKKITTSGPYESAKIANEVSRLVEEMEKKGKSKAPRE